MIKGTVYKKVRDEGNILGWDLIELLERRPSNHTTVVTVEKQFGAKDPQYKQSETGLYQETTTITPCDWVIRCTNGDGSVDINSMDEDDLYESLMDGSYDVETKANAGNGALLDHLAEVVGSLKIAQFDNDQESYREVITAIFAEGKK